MLNEWDKALHDEIHASMLSENPRNLLNGGRLDILDKLKKKKFKIEGVIADIGCGSGYFGIGLAKKFPGLLRIDCIESSKLAVEKIIPRNVEFHEVGKIVKPILGSFDNLESKKYDIIFAMGALHHSQDLNKTLKSIATALKPEGFLVAQEPTMPDNTTHEDYQFKYNIVEERFGLKIRNGDRFDRFFSECEYKYFLITNGFDINLWEDYELKIYKRSAIKRLKSLKNYLAINGYKKTLIKVLNSFKKLQPEKWKIDMQKAVADLKPKLIIAKKSIAKEIFHEK